MPKDTNTTLVREYYQQMPDEELTRLAAQEMSGLTPESLEIVKEELRKRGLTTDLAKSIDAQTHHYTNEEIEQYCNLIRRLPCPSTGSTDQMLNASLIVNVKSFILFTNYSKRLIIGSPASISKAHNSALLSTALLGWWGFPWEIIRSIQSLVVNLRNKNSSHQSAPGKYLLTFVLAKIGEIERYRDNPQQLQRLIAAYR